MSTNGRRKGKDGENEIAGILRDLTGWSIKRRVRQHDGDSDLDGVPGWSVEVKRHATAARGEIRKWWAQARSQAVHQGLEVGRGLEPVLFFRRDRDEWRAVWSPHWHLEMDYEWTVEASIEAWAAVARERAAWLAAAKENA